MVVVMVVVVVVVKRSSSSRSCVAGVPPAQSGPNPNRRTLDYGRGGGSCVRSVRWPPPPPPSLLYSSAALLLCCPAVLCGDASAAVAAVAAITRRCRTLCRQSMYLCVLRATRCYAAAEARKMPLQPKAVAGMGSRGRGRARGLGVRCGRCLSMGRPAWAITARWSRICTVQ